MFLSQHSGGDGGLREEGREGSAEGRMRRLESWEGQEKETREKSQTTWELSPGSTETQG